MLVSAAVPVPTGEINWNPGSGEAVLEGDTYPSGTLIDAAIDCEGRPSRPGRRWRIGHCSGCRNAPPRLIIHIVNPAICELSVLIWDVVARPSPAAVLVARLPEASEVTICVGPVC